MRQRKKSVPGTMREQIFCGFFYCREAARQPFEGTRRNPPYFALAAFLLSHLLTHSAQEISPVMFSVVRPMSKMRSTP